jgi:hypothetical protein
MMRRDFKIGAGLVALFVAVLCVTPVQAAFVTNGNSISGTLQDWINLGSTGVQQQDKLWVYGGSTLLSGATPVTFTFETLGNGTDIHTLAIGDVNFAESGATLNYTIQVTTPNDGGLNDFVFLNGTLDTATNGGGTNAVKNFTTAGTGSSILTLTSTNGVPQTGNFPGSLTKLFVAESWTVQANGDINQTFNPFTEGKAAVPEPLSVVVWTLLLACVGMAIRLRRR